MCTSAYRLGVMSRPARILTSSPSGRAVMLLALVAMAPCGRPLGSFYYVSPAGNDTNDCTAANPCRQIRKALTLIQPGDTIYVADGVYLGFTAQGVSGTATNPITIKAQATNAYVFAMTDRPDNRDNIFITFCQWLVIDGLKRCPAIYRSQQPAVQQSRLGDRDVSDRRRARAERQSCGEQHHRPGE